MSKRQHDLGNYYNRRFLMAGLGKGIGIGLCGLGIGWAAAATGEPGCCGAFVALIFVSLFWG